MRGGEASGGEGAVHGRAHRESLLREGSDVLAIVARRLARRLGRHVRLDDLEAIGAEALLTIVDRYDPTRSKFRSYAALKLRWAIFDGLRRETHGRVAAVRAHALMAAERVGAELAPGAEPEAAGNDDSYRDRLRALLEGHAAALVVGLIAPAGDLALVPEDVDSPEDAAARRQVAGVLRRAVDELPDRERALVERHYFADEQFDAIAADLGISKSWASRLHAQAIVSLGRALRGVDG